MNTENNRYWVAGLLEGEGYFTYQKTKDGHYTIRVGCNMTDLDVLERLRSILDLSNKIYTRKQNNVKMICAF